jgi:hypothetical protein
MNGEFPHAVATNCLESIHSQFMKRGGPVLEVFPVRYRSHAAVLFISTEADPINSFLNDNKSLWDGLISE